MIVRLTSETYPIACKTLTFSGHYAYTDDMLMIPIHMLKEIITVMEEEEDD